MKLKELQALIAAYSPLGVIGSEAIKEAFNGDLRQLQDLLVGKIKKVLELSGDDDWWPYIRALFPDFIVVEMKDGKLMKYPYEADGTDVMLGMPSEVMLSYEDVKEASAEGTGGISPIGSFMEANGEAGSTYKIRIIRAGKSLNNAYYPDTVLREAVSLFNGVRVFAKSDAEHLAGQGKDINKLIGVIDDVQFVEGVSTDTGELQGTLKLIEPEGEIGTKIYEAWARSLTSLFGFSIDAHAKIKKKNVAGTVIREAIKFTKVTSVDLIVEPGAGGEIINLLEAKKETVMDRDAIVALLEAKGLLKSGEADGMTDAQLAERLTEAVGSADQEQDLTNEQPSGQQAGNQGGADTGSVETIMEAVQLNADMRAAVNRSALPEAGQERVIESFAGRTDYTPGDVTSAITNELQYLGLADDSGNVQGMGARSGIIVGDSNLNAAQMFEAFLDPSHENHRHARSIRQIYTAITGDINISGRIENCDASRMREAFAGAEVNDGFMREAISTGTFANVLSSQMHRRMISQYQAQDRYDAWRDVVTIGTASDYRDKHTTIFGGYGDLPGVAQRGDYNPLQTPTDQKASFSVSKRGGTESISIETIANDDVMLVRQIPIKLAMAAKRTLSKFVFDLIETNPSIYDGENLISAAHNNLHTAAFGANSLEAMRIAMLHQTEISSDARLSIPARTLLVPDVMQRAAVDLFRRDTENDPKFVSMLNYDIVPVWYWEDPNNFYLLADKDESPVIEIAFKSGEEDPLLYIQDDPKNGSLFSNDVITWKIKHTYGGTNIDYRGIQGAIVL
jgi:hypothetical protein